jgi:ribonuclease BN (tRNA processing enzyme)
MDDLLFGESAIDEEAEHEGDQVVAEMTQRYLDFIRDADLLVFDAQYTAAEYPSKIGWGHSTVEDAIRISCLAGVKRCALFHHEPTRADEGMDQLEQFCAEELIRQKRSGSVIFAAREGQEIVF